MMQCIQKPMARSLEGAPVLFFSSTSYEEFHPEIPVGPRWMTPLFIKRRPRDLEKSQEEFQELRDIDLAISPLSINSDRSASSYGWSRAVALSGTHRVAIYIVYRGSNLGSVDLARQ